MRTLLPLLLLIAASMVHADGADFTKVCMSGESSGQGSCPSNPQPGSNPNEWACTRDNSSKLVWSLESGSGNWDYAITSYPKTMNAVSRCGFNSGWRAPTRKELLTILDRRSSSKQAIDAHYFPGNIGDWYWTADTFAPDPTYAWFVFFVSGYKNEGNAYSGFKTYVKNVRLVHDAH